MQYQPVATLRSDDGRYPTGYGRLVDGLFVEETASVRGRWGEPGDEVIYRGSGGHRQDRAEADAIFEYGQVLVVTGIRIRHGSSQYRIEGHGAKLFNTTLFEMVE